MSVAEYDAWYPRAVHEYVEDHIKAGSMPADKAHEMAANQFAELLPDGVETAEHHLLMGESGGERVGLLWLRIPAATTSVDVNAFVYDVEVDADKRGAGFGRGLMLAAETYAADHGASTIKLHVFGSNTVARALYESLGYETTNVAMARPLGPATT